MNELEKGKLIKSPLEILYFNEDLKIESITFLDWAIFLQSKTAKLYEK